MTDIVDNSQLIAVGTSDDSDRVMIAIGNPLGEYGSYELTYGNFEHAIGRLNEVSLQLQMKREATTGLSPVVPLELEEEFAEESLGGAVVFLLLRGKGMPRAVPYSLSPERAVKLAESLLVAAKAATSQSNEPRH